jgi:hypothetical protein
MNTIAHHSGIGPLGGRTPYGGRTPGGALLPQPVGDPSWTTPGPPTDFTVGVVDTGALLTWANHTAHPYLAHHLSLCPEDDEDVVRPVADGVLPSLGPADGHGTFVAGLILKEAPQARIRMAGALDVQRVAPNGLGAAEDRTVAAAIRALAVNPRVQVINLSFGGAVFSEDYERPTLLRAALEDVDYDRVAVVAAAGNEPSGARVWPAAFDGVIAVGAAEHVGELSLGAPQVAEFSNRGSWVAAYANGVKVVGPYLDQTTLMPAADDAHLFRGWASWSGTSFAAASVSGRIARLAMDRGVSGAWAARLLLDEAEDMPGELGKLIR